ncbi:MAG: 4Fe-4S binding protein [Candidatus Zixiibacteriota bacterium]|nr:MAG: 4Fe-4S binding protein [candidate division Zixibacteria bacterium]
MLVIDQSLCLECGGCVPLCPEEALRLSFDNLMCNDDLCIGCGVCIDFCPTGAVEEGRTVEV